MTEEKSFVLGPHLDFCLYWDKKKVKRKSVKFDIRRADYFLCYLLPSSTVNSSLLSVMVSSVSSNFYFDIPQLVIIWWCNVSKIIRFRISIFSTFRFNFDQKHFHPTCFGNAHFPYSECTSLPINPLNLTQFSAAFSLFLCC